MNKSMEKQQSELQLDKSRVTLLLEINAELLREVLQIQPKLKTPEEAKNDPTFREFVPIFFLKNFPPCIFQSGRRVI